MGEVRSRLRTAFAEGLLKAATVLALAPLVIHVILLIAGTFYVNNAAREGSLLIGLCDLSMISFDGIILSNATAPDAPSFLVKLQWFPSAFAWSWPDAPPTDRYWEIGAAPLTTSAILMRGPRRRFDPFNLIQVVPGTTGGIVGVPREEFRCLRSPYSRPDKGQECTNPFWAAVQRTRDYRFEVPMAWLSFTTHVAVPCMVILVLVAEWCIRRKPYWMRCQCLSVFKPMCPLPKGSREEIETMDEHAWDRIRLSLYGMIVLYAILPAVHGSFLAAMFASSLHSFDQSLPSGMSVRPRMGRPFLFLAWSGVVVAMLAFLCVLIRWSLTRRDVWMERQASEPLLAGEEERRELIE